MMAKLGLECALVCRQEDRCQSINFIMSVGMCEFNDRTKEAARAEDFVPDPDSYYYRRDMKRGKLVRKHEETNCRFSLSPHQNKNRKPFNE